MKVIIAGSRSISDPKVVEPAVLNSGFDVTVVVSGCARGIDTFGEHYANRNKLGLLRFPADWGKYGRAAGFKRNERMAEVADALVAIHDGKSKGTLHMIETMLKLRKPVYTEVIKK